MENISAESVQKQVVLSLDNSEFVPPEMESEQVYPRERANFPFREAESKRVFPPGKEWTSFPPETESEQVFPPKTESKQVIPPETESEQVFPD